MVKNRDLIEIYFNDLKEEVQKELLEIYGIKGPEELNADVMPLAVIPLEIDPNLD